MKLKIINILKNNEITNELYCNTKTDEHNNFIKEIMEIKNLFNLEEIKTK